MAVKKVSTNILKNRINRDLDETSAAVQIIGLRRVSGGYQFQLPCDQFDSVDKEDYQTVVRIVKKHCGKVV